MNNEVLSQDEINALLEDDNNESNNNGEVEERLEDLEKDAIGEVANISMGSAATALYGLLDQKVEITAPTVTLSSVDELVASYNKPCVLVDVQYVEGLEGSNQLIMQKRDAAIIADLMMGGDGIEPPEELTDLHISAVGEAMNQMMGSASTSMSDFFEGDKINISPPQAELLTISSDDIKLDVSDPIVKVAFDMHIGDLIDSQIVQVMTVNFAKSLADALMNPSSSSSDEDTKVIKQQQEEQVNQKQPAQQSMQQQASQQSHPNQQQGLNQSAQQPMQGSMQQNVEVQDVEFNQLNNGNKGNINNDLDMLYDIPLELTVRLGKTKMSIKDILDLGSGSVIELDRLAGEAVDLLVNGKLIAKGEVVVIDENFGFRVTSIVSSAERIKKL